MIDETVQEDGWLLFVETNRWRGFTTNCCIGKITQHYKLTDSLPSLLVRHVK